MLTYTTAQGHELQYDDTPPGAVAFLSRVLALASHGGTTEDDLIELIYSAANPILGPYPFGGRGAVTRETLDNPIYHVMTDCLFRARLAAHGKAPEQAGARYTLTVTEAAGRVGVSRAAIQKAIKTGRLDSWVRGGQYYLWPDDVDRFAAALPETRRGYVSDDAPAVGAPLVARVGGTPGVTFRLKVSEAYDATSRESGHVFTGTIRAGWKTLAVSYSSKTDTGTHRTFLLVVPGDKETEIEHEGFFLRGRFTVQSKRTGERAAVAWREFQPEP